MRLRVEESESVGSQPVGDSVINRWLAAITFRQACGYLPSRRASPPFGQYQIILLVPRVVI